MTGPAPSILIVDDEPQNRRLLEVLLQPEGYITRTAAGGAEALASIEKEPPDLILLDVMMPGIDGNQVAALLKADPATSGIPIVMVTAQTDWEARLAGLEAGAEDFLTKPINRAELWLRVRNHLRLKELADLLSDHGDHLEAQVLARTSDLQYLAHFDSLTTLPNRTFFYETLDKTLQHAATQGWTVAVVFIDLDHFKNVNDTLGHALGDELLLQVSHRLLDCVRLRDTVGRFGGDEFALILVLDDGPQGAAAVATKVQAALREPFDLQGHEVTVSASLGITAFPDDAADPETLIRYADTAMYEAKQAGRDTFRFFTPEMNTEALARLQLETALRRAVRDDEFVLHYQPKLHIEVGRVSGFEALLRWERPGHGLLPPGEFIAILEDSGLIVDVGRWVINTVCEQVAAWQRSPVGPRQVSVNVSGRQFVDGDLQGDVLHALEVSGIPPDLLELELTESSLMANTARTITTLEGLKARGVQISIDDFGTGYSSLAYLRRFPIDKLKIDTSFVRDITTDPDSAAIAQAIIRMAHSLNLDVIAEGVETEAQLEYLRRHHCDQMQGYLYSKALAVSDLERLLADDEGLPVVGTTAPQATLLLVDDDVDMLRALTMLLDGDGYQVLTAASAVEGFEMLARHEVQVIVCDHRMPGMTGTDFLDRVKELHPRALRIMLSAATDDGSLIGSINRGEVYRYYTKPWDAEHLRHSLRDAFRHYWHLGDAPHDTPGAPSMAPTAISTPSWARASRHTSFHQ